MVRSLEDFKLDLEKRDNPQITSEQIEEYNSQPEVKDKGVKLIKESTDKLKTGFLIAALILAASFGVFAYLAYNGNLNLSTTNCPEITFPELKCPDQAACNCPQQVCSPSINFTCPNLNLNNLTIKMVNSTG